MAGRSGIGGNDTGLRPRPTDDWIDTSGQTCLFTFAAAVFVGCMSHPSAFSVVNLWVPHTNALVGV